MANVNNISSNSYSSTSSIYGNRNVLTGLASGMDTEAMIENSVTGYQTKIAELQQSQTKVEWKQDAIRGLIDQMNEITLKYTSYTSKTNLASNTFFNNAMTTTTNGTNAAAVSATGVAKSDIQIDAVKQLATSARYSVDASALDINSVVNLQGSTVMSGGTKSVSNISGSLTLTLGKNKYTLNFKDDDVYADAEALVEGINEKLKEQKVDATATLSGGQIKFTSTSSNGDAVYISGSSGNFKSVLGVESASSSAATNRFDFNSISVGGKELSRSTSVVEYLSDKKISVTYNGLEKSISVGTLDMSGDKTMLEQIAENLQTNLNAAFGTGAVTVSQENGALSFAVKENTGATLMINSDVKELGFGSGLSNYFNTNSTLGSLLGDDYFTTKGTFDSDDQIGTLTNANGQLVDSTGARVNAEGYLLDDDGELAYDEKELVINGVNVGTMGKDDKLESVLNKINSNANVGVNVSYSDLTGQFVFTSRETGSGGKIEFDSPLAQKLFKADNSPEAVTAEKMLGDFGNWDENGEMKLYLNTGSSGRLNLGVISKSTTVEELINRINTANSAYQNVVSFDSETGTYKFHALDGSEMDSETAASMFQFVDRVGNKTAGALDLLSSVKGGVRTAGKDAQIEATVNGKQISLTRSSNVVAMDGLTVTLKETFEAEKAADAVTFTTRSDADKVVDTIKSFVEDVNKLMNDVHSAYTTQPLTKSSSNHNGYEPLTESDKQDMSETAIAAYEEKAKTGILFGDTDLSTLYNKLYSVVQASGSDRIDMESIGLSTTYSNGVTTFSLDESKLRAALENNPDKVRTVFTKTTEGGSSSNGLMASLKSTLTAYGSTSIGSPGILVRKAGSKLSSTSLLNNTMQAQIDNISKQIESWQTKLSDKIDYYTKQFTQLEKLMSTMNNQSSMLAELMGY
ncbi:MAG: hypothetical protein E7474_09145 [Ruminococcaceae bacterium]|nr:hypothetical protein [Oscillospiraceae bacterium]